MFFRKKNLDTLSIAQQAVARLRTDNSRIRRQAMKKRLDYYYGKQLNYLDELLSTQFKNPERLKLQKEFLNITQLIIDELAVLYSQPPKRELIDIGDKSDATDKLQAAYQEVISCGRLDSTMALANKLSKLCKTVLVRPVWRDEKIEFDIYTPNMFDVIQDPSNPTKALAIIYCNQVDYEITKQINNDDKRISQDPFALPNTIYYVWTKEKHFGFTYTMSPANEIKITLEQNDGNKDNINPYKMLPFVCIYDGIPLDNFFVEGGDDLINSNEINNVKLVEKNHLTKMQSFSIPVRKGADNTKDEMILDPSMLVDIPADDDVRKGSDFYFVSPDAKIQEIDDDIQSRLTRLATKHKLNPEMFKASGNRSSADSLQMQAYYLGKVISADKPVYAYFEKELFEVMRTVYNYHAKSDKLPEEANLFIDYKDIEVPSTVEQEDAHNLIMHQNGLMSKADWLMKENPDIRDADQAEEKLAEIDEEAREAKKQNMQDMMDMAGGKLPMDNKDNADNPNDSGNGNPNDKQNQMTNE